MTKVKLKVLNTRRRSEDVATGDTWFGYANGFQAGTVFNLYFTDSMERDPLNYVAFGRVQRIASRRGNGFMLYTNTGRYAVELGSATT